MKNYFASIALFALLFTTIPFAANAQDCTNPDGYVGEIIRNSSIDVLQGCTTYGWQAFHAQPGGSSDTTPDAFSFTDQTGVATSTVITSNSVTINGIDASTPVSVSGDGSPEIRINGGSWTTSGTIENGQTLEVRLTSNASNSTMNSATIDVGGVTDQWDVTTGAPDPCTGSPTPGTTCADGSIYAGQSPDGNVPMYTTPADAPGTYSWNDGTSNWADMSGLINCSDNSPGTAITCQTGEANTAFLVAATSETDYPFAAAEYCDSLNAHGHNDWYLPSQDELNALYTNNNAGDLNGTFSAAFYWSSSERNFNYARAQNLSNGGQGSAFKRDAFLVRCVRR